MTRQVESTFGRLSDAIDVDLAEELGFLDLFDQSLRAVERIVDLPDRRAREFVQLVLQNDGRLARRKRGRYPELSDDEIAALEAAVRAERDVVGGNTGETFERGRRQRPRVGYRPRISFKPSITRASSWSDARAMRRPIRSAASVRI